MQNTYFMHSSRRIAKSIVYILGMKLGTFLFSYLGALISPTRIKVNQFQSLVDKAHLTARRWNASCISQAGRIVLIIMTPMATPIRLFLGSHLDFTMVNAKTNPNSLRNFQMFSSSSSLFTL